MKIRFFTTASASAALVLAMGVNAAAADIRTTNTGYKNPGISYVDRGGKAGLLDVVVEAGTDPGVVQLHFAGAQKVVLGDLGVLMITRADGTIWRYRPPLYQTVNGKRRELIAGFHFV